MFGALCPSLYHQVGFQSLFSWNLLLMGDLKIKLPDGTGFNPCFRGTCSWWYSHRRGSVTNPMFQSLFSWNLLLMPSELQQQGLYCILFQSLFSWNLLLMFFLFCLQNVYNFGFNPCFRGTCSWWQCCPGESDPRYTVSILVFVELALDVRSGLAVLPKENSFNPCFRGTCSWCVDVSRGCRKSEGFNPCFRGTCSWCRRRTIMPWLLWLFQSLFSWNLLLMLALDTASMWLVRSFNPCFRGTCSWWPEKNTVVSSRELFQSLFSWNLLLMGG